MPPVSRDCTAKTCELQFCVVNRLPVDRLLNITKGAHTRHESVSLVRLGELDSGARLGYISPHTHEWIPKLCSYISVSRMSSSKQVAAAVIILDECGVFGRKRKNRKRREMWAKKGLLGRDRYTHLNLLNFIRNSSPEDYQNYLRMSDENVQYLIAKVKPLVGL